MRRRRYFDSYRYHYSKVREEEMLMGMLVTIIAIIVFLIFLIIIEYGRILLILLILSSIGFIAFLTTSLIIKRVRFIKTRNVYLDTEFYKETEMPFTKEILSRELNFQI